MKLQPNVMATRQSVTTAAAKLKDGFQNHRDLLAVCLVGSALLVSGFALSERQATTSRVVMTEDKVVAPAQATSATAQSEIININTASSSELDKLPGVGPVIAQRIVDYRSSHGPFTAIDQIQDVKGIGPATFGKMQSQISVE